MDKVEQISKFSLKSILEKKGDPAPTAKSGPGSWVGDNLVINVYTMGDIVNRVLQIRGLKQNSPEEKILRKVLPPIVKGDKNFTNSLIDIMSDKDMNGSEKADMIDTNIEEFFDTHAESIEKAVGVGQKPAK